MKDYEKQAKDFLKKTKSTIEKSFFKHDYYFDGDKEKIDIYNITIKRGQRQISFTFGQSINNSTDWLIRTNTKTGKIVKLPLSNFTQGMCGKITDADIYYKLDMSSKNLYGDKPLFIDKIQRSIEPTDYDILACVEKYDPETFEFFCDNYGYDTDSRKAEKIYNSVKKQYLDILSLYNDEELELLREIQ